MAAEASHIESTYETKRYRPLGFLGRVTFITLIVVGLVMSFVYIFRLQPFGFILFELSYYYVMMACFLPAVFLTLPLRSGNFGRRLFRLDVVLCLLSFGIAATFAYQGLRISLEGWAYRAPLYMVIMAFIMWALLLEAGKRAAGPILISVVFVFSIYPLFASHMPGLFEGAQIPAQSLASYHMLSLDSAVGIIFKSLATLFVGFIVFGVALKVTGGGKFFLDLALSIMGQTRGGAAKVAVISSGLFGSLSGSAISNVITTGSVTIPAMKRSGYAAHYAGAIECVASTGGAITPPVMAIVAFIMASFLDIPYWQVASAAVIPAFLYYFGLFIQVDALAAKQGLVGLPRNELPSFKKTLMSGWIYIVPALLLVYALVVLRVEARAPFYATALLLVLAMLRRETRFTPRSFLQFIEDTGRALCELTALLLAVGMIMGSLGITGLCTSLSREIFVLAGGNLAFMLILAALASFILGMGIGGVALYIFLVITVVPGLIMTGLNEVAVHFFVLYCGLMSAITPPVAVVAMPASIIAGAPYLKVATRSAVLGGVIYVVPFFFVLDPALILQAGGIEIAYAFFSCVLGVFLIASALQGRLAGIGRMGSGTLHESVSRIACLGAGVLLGLPTTKVLGLAIAAAAILSMLLLRSRSRTSG